MPALDSESSTRLRLLSFPLIVGVVYVHAYFTTITYRDGVLGTDQLNLLTDFTRTVISQGFARISVPLFFFMSGFFFFLGFKWSLRGYVMKLAGRVRTLLVPYLIWTTLGVGILILGQEMPFSSPYFHWGGHRVAAYPLFDILNGILGLTWVPVAYHFWFIRDLMVLMVLSPLILLILRYAAIPFFLVVYLLWVSSTWPLPIPDPAGVLFFSAGCFLALKDKNPFGLDRYGPWFMVAYTLIVIADAVWYHEPFNIYIHRSGIVVGVVAALYSTRLVLPHQRLKQAILWLSGSSFFVYAAHEPLLGILRTIAYSFIPFDWPYTMLLVYLFLPATLIAFLVWLHTALAVRVPRALAIVTGGR